VRVISRLFRQLPIGVRADVSVTLWQALSVALVFSSIGFSRQGKA